MGKGCYFTVITFIMHLKYNPELNFQCKFPSYLLLLPKHLLLPGLYFDEEIFVFGMTKSMYYQFKKILDAPESKP